MRCPVARAVTGTSGRWAMLAVLCASLLLVAMDATILHVALPSLIDDLQPSAVQQLWITDIYGLVLGGLLVTTAAVGDRFGRRKLFLIGFVLFGVASVVTATSETSAQRRLRRRPGHDLVRLDRDHGRRPGARGVDGARLLQDHRVRPLGRCVPVGPRRTALFGSGNAAGAADVCAGPPRGASRPGQAPRWCPFAHSFSPSVMQFEL